MNNRSISINISAWKRPVTLKAGSDTAGMPALYLHKGQTLSIRGSFSTCSVTCLSGMVWVTQGHRARDYILRGSGSVVLDKTGTITLWAVKESNIAISACRKNVMSEMLNPLLRRIPLFHYHANKPAGGDI